MGVSLLALAACGRDGTGPTEASANLFRFDFTGATSGTYLAEGLPPEDGSIRGSYAVSYPGIGEDFALYSFRATVAPRGDFFLLTAPPVPGTYKVECDEVDRCFFLFGYMNLDASTRGHDAGEKRFVIQSGSVTVTTVTDGRVQGTFAGSGITVDRPTGAVGTLVVSDGRFDVERRPTPLAINFSAAAEMVSRIVEAKP